MTDWSSIKRTLEDWEHDCVGVGQGELETLLTDVGYEVQTAVDYRSVKLYYKKDWPRFMGKVGTNELAAESLRRTILALLTRISEEGLA